MKRGSNDEGLKALFLGLLLGGAGGQQVAADEDMLDMLKEKAKGNLSAEEDRFLTNLLKELKLNFVDEAGKPDTQTGTPEPPKTGEVPQ